MIRRGRWKYTYRANDLAELYDLESDPEELRNLAAEPDYSARASELWAELLAWHRPG